MTAQVLNMQRCSGDQQASPNIHIATPQVGHVKKAPAAVNGNYTAAAATYMHPCGQMIAAEMLLPTNKGGSCCCYYTTLVHQHQTWQITQHHHTLGRLPAACCTTLKQAVDHHQNTFSCCSNSIHVIAVMWGLLLRHVTLIQSLCLMLPLWS